MLTWHQVGCYLSWDGSRYKNNSHFYPLQVLSQAVIECFYHDSSGDTGGSFTSAELRLQKPVSPLLDFSSSKGRGKKKPSLLFCILYSVRGGGVSKPSLALLIKGEFLKSPLRILTDKE